MSLQPRSFDQGKSPKPLLMGMTESHRTDAGSTGGQEINTCAGRYASARVTTAVRLRARAKTIYFAARLVCDSETERQMP